MAIKYIMPDWDDYLDTDFNFKLDQFSNSTNETRHFSYLHELMEKDTPYDGMLVSLNQISKKKGALKKHGVSNSPKTIREIMRLPAHIQIIGDCGAFSYKNLETPPITPEDAAKLYDEYGFDMGASVDHMVVDEIEKTDNTGKKLIHKLTDTEKDARVRITIENARAFIRAVEANGYKFTPLGSIQARTPEEYASTFQSYIEMGYRQVALGALIPKKDDEIRKIILAVGCKYRELPAEIKPHVGIHLFGILRPALFPLYAENGISSFDSASYFRKAWLKSDKNYLAANGNWYAAIRIPQSELPRNKKALESAKHDLAQVAVLEQDLLRRLNCFDAQTEINPLLDDLMTYDAYFDRISDGGEKLKEAYRKVLTDRPWEQCNCKICKDLGIHVLIFRGYNRNKRRGFHNTYVFYHEYAGGKKHAPSPKN